MLDFEYYAPTKVFFGKDAESKVGGVLREQGFEKVLLVYGGGSVIKSGLLDRVKRSLEENQMKHCELGGVEPNPKIGLIRQGIRFYKSEEADFVLAVGGGSVIDTAKSICMGVANNLDPWDMIQNGIVPKKMCPMGSVLTIAAAGSEMSWSHVVSNPETQEKKSLNHDLLRPMFAFLNPENTYSVSKYQTGCGIVDIMMHTMERYFTVEDHCDLTDRISEGLLKAVKEAGVEAVKNPCDYNARATLMWAGSLSHNGLTGCGKQAYWAPHKIEQDLSGIFDNVAHGAGLSVIFPAWCKYVYKKDIRKFCQLAVRLWDIEMNFEDPEKTALAGIEACKNYFRDLGMPVSMKEIGIAQSDYERIADKSTKNGSICLKSYIEFGKKEILEMFQMAE